MRCLKPTILATYEVEIGRIKGLRHGGQKVLETPISTNESWEWWHVPVIPAMQKA
jgi:hypothetical protein